MTHYFLDSSALIKRYVVEIGTNWVRSIALPTSGNTVIVSHIIQVEVVSGTMRRKREGTINSRTARAIRLLTDRHCNRQYVVLGFNDQIAQHAEDLLEKHPLRAYDSIQLASALESNYRLIGAGLPPLIFISSDNRLLAIAIAEGLTTDDPNAHP